MREIKFRGKSKSKGEWLYGDFITDTKEYNRTCDKAYILPYWDTLNGPISVDKKSVGQYTGLKDANGVEIYEGDITIDSHGTVTFVDFEDGQYVEKIIGSRDRKQIKEKFPLLKKNASRCEIIDNIYENPELLEESK